MTFVHKRSCLEQSVKSEPDSKKKKKITYTIKFFDKKLPLGTRNTESYKLALREAERWVLAGKGYISRIEWEVVTGTKYVEFDYYAVQQQRKARIAYKRQIKTNQFQSPYVSI